MSSRTSSREDKEALALHRQGLKAQLWKTQEKPTWLSSRGRTAQRPPCPWCEDFIWFPDECVMHEWLIKRSDVPVKIQMAIMHEYNCVLAHYHCHEKHGQTTEFKLRCARAQYRRYGRDTIVAWVGSLGLKQHVEIPLGQEEE